MKSNLKAKYLQYLTQKKQDEGFTLIELLVVIIIVGILSAIALPSFLNQANKAKESEAVLNVSAINRAQQTYRLGNTQFATGLPDLAAGIDNDTANFTFTISSAGAVSTVALATPKDLTAVRGIVGGVGVLTAGATDAILCKNTAVGTPAAPTFAAASGWGCASTTENLN